MRALRVDGSTRPNAIRVTVAQPCQKWELNLEFRSIDRLQMLARIFLGATGVYADLMGFQVMICICGWLCN